MSRFTSPFKIKPSGPQPSTSGATKGIKRTLFLGHEKSDNDFSCSTEALTDDNMSSSVAPSSSRVSDSDSNVTETNANIEKL